MGGRSAAACTHTHTNTHTQAHTHTQTHTRTHKQTHAYTYTHPKPSLDSLDWFASECRRVAGDVLAPTANDRRMVVLRQPVGVVGAITPWNFPFSMITRKVGAGAASACASVCACDSVCASV